MVRPVKSGCCSRLRNKREKTTTTRRTRNPLTVDKESKLTIGKIYMKNVDYRRQDAAIECQL